MWFGNLLYSCIYRLQFDSVHDAILVCIRLTMDLLITYYLLYTYLLWFELGWLTDSILTDYKLHLITLHTHYIHTTQTVTLPTHYMHLFVLRLLKN